VITITAAEKSLDFRGEPKTSPRKSEETPKVRSTTRKGKSKDKGKTKPSKGVMIMPRKQTQHKRRSRFHVGFIPWNVMRRVVP
jgi:hypothetical protein